MTHNLLIVSDVHLCRPRPGMVEGGQRELARFLDHHAGWRVEERPWRLILNGDLFDFDYEAEGLEARGPEAASLRLFERVAAAFDEVFRALADFLDQGHALVVIPGNHDVDLMWPSVRVALRSRLGALCRTPGADARLQFRDWFHYEPGRIYVEHGHRFDPDTHIADLLHPFDSLGRLRRSLGTYWISGFCPRIPELAYHVDHTRSPLYYLPILLRRYGIRAPGLWLAYVRFALRTVAAAGRQHARPGDLHAERRRALAGAGADEMSQAMLARLEAASASPRLASRLATAARLHVVPALLLPVAALLGAGALLFASRALGLGAAAVLVVVLLTNALVSTRYRASAEDRLRRGARAVRAALSVPVVALGHVHVATDEPIDAGRYLNSGTWMLATRPLTYLRIVGGDAEVCTWSGRPR